MCASALQAPFKAYTVLIEKEVFMLIAEALYQLFEAWFQVEVLLNPIRIARAQNPSQSSSNIWLLSDIEG